MLLKIEEAVQSTIISPRSLYCYSPDNVISSDSQLFGLTIWIFAEFGPKFKGVIAETLRIYPEGRRSLFWSWS